MNEPPTGIVRTLPPIYADPSHQACQGYRATVAEMEADPDGETVWFMALAQQPRFELLHVYVLIAGKIEARFNLAGYRAGSASRLWDGVIRHPKAWAICAGPVSRPPEPIRMRGFQGFRYIRRPLW